MEIRIDKKSEIPVRQQLAEQITFSIATEKLKPGEALPSVRELSRLLKIHRNTVSQAYRDLKRRAWLAGERGSRVVVRGLGKQARRADASDLDDLINATIHLAHEHGYTLQKLRERVRTRLLAQPPDRVLVVEQEQGLRLLLENEIRSVIDQPIESCGLADLSADPDLAIGALTVAGKYLIRNVDPLVPNGMPAIPLAFSSAQFVEEAAKAIHHFCCFGERSVSKDLKTARSLLAPAVGKRHRLCEFTFPLSDQSALNAADFVFADSIVSSQVKHPRVIPHRVVQPSSLEYRFVGADLMSKFASVRIDYSQHLIELEE